MATLKSSEPIDELIDARKVALVLKIERRFTRDLLTGRAAPVQIIVDGRNSKRRCSSRATSALSSPSSRSPGAPPRRPPPPAVLDMRARYNPTLASRWIFLPSLVALLTQLATLLVVSLTVAREREKGTFDQLLVTPLRRSTSCSARG